MSKKNVSDLDKLKADAEELDKVNPLEQENESLRETNEALLEGQHALEQRILAMEELMNAQTQTGEYAGPEPALYHDPFDMGVNPHIVKKHPQGKILSWMNPNIRNSSHGWKGWVPIEYDDEYGQRLSEFISDPPAKMQGGAQQDNYVRRGTDSILCWIDEEIYLARQEKRERKALHKQMAANNSRNRQLGPGVETFGDGVQIEGSVPGGFKSRKGATPLVTEHPAHRTEMFEEE